MSFVSRVLRRWGYVRLKDYGLALTDDGQIVPITDRGIWLAAPSWQSLGLPLVPPPPPPAAVFARPVEPRGAPVVVAASVDPVAEEDDEEEWEWRLAMARAKAAIEAAEADALTAPVKRVPTIEVVIATAPVAPAVVEEPVDEPEAVTVITPAATMAENLAACRAQSPTERPPGGVRGGSPRDDEDEPTVVAIAPARMAERMRREVHAEITSEPTTRPAIEVIEAAIAAAAPLASDPPRRPRTQPIGIIAQRPAGRRDNGFSAAAAAIDAAWATPAAGAVARTIARATPPPIPERARRTTPPPIRLESDAEPLTDEEIAEALSLSEDTVVTVAAPAPIVVEVELRPHRRAAMGTPAPLPRLSSARTPLPRLSAFLRTRGRR